MIKKMIENKLLLCLLLILLFIFINFLILSLTVLLYPYDLDITEGFLLIPSIKFLTNGVIYGDIHSTPQYFITKYPPIFYIFNAFTIILFGMNLFSARIISFFSSFIIGFLIYLIVKKLTKNKLLGILAFFFFFSSYVTIQMVTQARVDVLATLFSLLGIYFMMDYKKKRNFYLAIIFFILSVFTKQSFITAPIASFVYLFMKKKRKGFEFLCLMVISGIFLLLLINLLSNGQFLFHILKGSTGIIEISPSFFFLRLNGSLIILGICVYYFLRNKKDLLSLYFIFSLFILFIQLARVGAWINYLFETTVMASIIIFLLVQKMKSNISKTLLICLFLLQLVIFVQNDPRLIFFVFQPNSYTPLVNYHSDQKISDYIKNSTGDILVEHATFAIINGKDIPPELWSIIELERLGLVNNYEVLNFIENQNYSIIIYYKNDRVPLINGLKEYIQKNYELIDEISWIDQNFANETWKVNMRI